jgi:hypothetical protein
MVLPMKTNIRLKIEADLLREARVLAAEEGTSISAMLAVQLEQLVRDGKGYHLAQKRALARLRRDSTCAGRLLLRGTNCMSDKFGGRETSARPQLAGATLELR